MLNTEDVFALTGEQMLQRRGLRMTDEIHHSMLGRRPDEAFQAMKDLTGITDSIESLKLETRELFSVIAEDHLAVMPGLLELLALIDELRLPRAVATSSPRDYMCDMLNRFDLLRHFSVTLTRRRCDTRQTASGNLCESRVAVERQSGQCSGFGRQRNRYASCRSGGYGNGFRSQSAHRRRRFPRRVAGRD